ncbi:MAG: DUF4258 domain-containing protein [Fibromonadaceae bacterium]|jgi:uncharacterized DUF497 family protein|nr:DUF4258 domain-containing protein [Fibromonadaceae bacterium]
MKPTISKHANKRGAERGISEEAVRAILASNATDFIPSKTDPGAVIVLGKHVGKVWAVVVNINTLNVITVRRAHKKEVISYEQKNNK